MNTEQKTATPGATAAQLLVAARILESLLYFDEAAAVRSAVAMLAHVNPVWYADGIDNERNTL
jgi:uncharacterized MAPEG superfamily protein